MASLWVVEVLAFKYSCWSARCQVWKLKFQKIFFLYLFHTSDLKESLLPETNSQTPLKISQFGSQIRIWRTNVFQGLNNSPRWRATTYRPTYQDLHGQPNFRQLRSPRAAPHEERYPIPLRRHASPLPYRVSRWPRIGQRSHQPFKTMVKVEKGKRIVDSQDHLPIRKSHFGDITSLHAICIFVQVKLVITSLFFGLVVLESEGITFLKPNSSPHTPSPERKGEGLPTDNFQQ